jgi:hypothetical protein
MATAAKSRAMGLSGAGFGLKEMYSVVRQRLSYFEEKWNVMDAILITLHLTTFILRASPGEKGMKLTNDQRMMGMQPDDVPANFTQVHAAPPPVHSCTHEHGCSGRNATAGDSVRHEVNTTKMLILLSRDAGLFVL